MEQVSSELKTVEEQLEICSEIGFKNMNLAELDRCFQRADQQAVDKAPETCGLKVDRSCQTEGKEEIPATASSVEPKPPTVPAKTSSTMYDWATAFRNAAPFEAHLPQAEMRRRYR